jgi:hypothetical protein
MAMIAATIRVVSTMLTVSLLLAGQAMVVQSEEIRVSNWVPNVGSVGQPLGDMWEFKCPTGGSFSARVDTKDDTDAGTARIDPVLIVHDQDGNILAIGDDELTCTFPPVCGFACPQVVNVACDTQVSSDRNSKHGAGRHHNERLYLVVRDFGAGTLGQPCESGGGYELTLEVSDRKGNQLNRRDVDLGGGSRRNVPDFALDAGLARRGPLLDDENVPAGAPYKKD